MKKYDPAKKKYVSIEEYEKTYNPRDKKLCRGKKPHDFVLILPPWVTYSTGYEFNPERYYDLLDELAEFEVRTYKKIVDMGVKSVYGGRLQAKKTSRYFACTVCNKREHQFFN